MLIKKKQKRVLVADDDRSARGFMRYILESSDYKIDSVETAARAMRKIKDNKYDLVVLDIALPGNMATKLFQILKQDKKYSEIPILFLLGPRSLETLSENRQKIVEAADAYIQKPLRATDFLAKIDELIGRYEHGKKSRSPKRIDSSPETLWASRRKQAVATKSLKGSGGKGVHD